MLLTFLLAREDVSQPVDGHALDLGQVVEEVHCREVVHFPLRTELGVELLGTDLFGWLLLLLVMLLLLRFVILLELFWLRLLFIELLVFLIQWVLNFVVFFV